MMSLKIVTVESKLKTDGIMDISTGYITFHILLLCIIVAVM